MARRGMLGMLAVGAVALLSACNPFAPSSYRYKMTIEMETPQGVQSFSSVRAIRYSSRLIDGGYNAHVRGEAIVMDLPGGPVFALLSGADGDADYAATIADAALESALRPGGANRDYRAGRFAEIYPTKPNIENYMPQNPLPMFVRFTDIDDPRSVQRVDPANLAASFGPGIRLKRITVEVTDDDVTTGIEKRLRWLGSGFPRIPLSDYPAVGTPLPLFATLTKMDFIRGFSK